MDFARYVIHKHFLLLCSYPFILLSVFIEQEVVNFDEVQLLNLFLSWILFLVVYLKHHQKTQGQNYIFIDF